MYVENFKPIENISSVSVKEHYLSRVEEMNMMEAKFSEIEEKLTNVSPYATHLVRVYLTGKPGSGKTQLALGYARKFYEERVWFYRYTFPRLAIVYLDASNLYESYPKVLELFNPEIDTKQMKLDDMKTEVEEKLKNITCWLLVADNVNSSAIKLPEPKITGRQVGRIVIVTSNRNVSKPKNFAKEHQLGGMTEQEAVDLLKKTSRHDGKYDEAIALVNFLGLLPLSITRY